ncbi:helix-turn-helix transcriptional regulator [Paludibaculum fermentans]|uniref:Helix-turn-helix transcriptional regulator n=1 Tax=Paludibaculum fermentans TaxID=1473598 RepID=A0A7S7NYN8_PALFE|nr:helix-turn-helix transcriptional regulator [Paludibaculum fermentans]
MLAKIAVKSNPGVTPPQAQVLARGDGWSVSEVVCTLGPRDRPFEERHSSVSIAIVAAGSFLYRSHAGRELLTPGSLMLGSAERSFECSHEHGTGDRCISFSYSPDRFDRLDAAPRFRAMRLPPVRPLSPLIAQASAVLAGAAGPSWEELGVELAARAVQLDRGQSGPPASAGPGAIARVARVLRTMESDPGAPHHLTTLAGEARLSPFHFLRTFQEVTGVTPHQFVLRQRLRRAALRLSTEPAKVVDIALECGFGDVSNFNRNFRAEFGLSPRAWRKFGRTVSRTA